MTALWCGGWPQGRCQPNWLRVSREFITNTCGIAASAAARSCHQINPGKRICLARRDESGNNRLCFHFHYMRHVDTLVKPNPARWRDTFGFILNSAKRTTHKYFTWHLIEHNIRYIALYLPIWSVFKQYKRNKVTNGRVCVWNYGMQMWVKIPKNVLTS